MNSKLKLYISIGLLLSITNTSMNAFEAYHLYSDTPATECTFVEDMNCIAITSKSGELTFISSDDCDNLLHSIFISFFNDLDKTNFSRFIQAIENILGLKKLFATKNFQPKYDAVIALLDKNRNNMEFKVWAKILAAPELFDLLPKRTQQFLDAIPSFKKVKTLISRLNN